MRLLRRARAYMLSALAASAAAAPARAETTVPRTIVALFDGADEQSWRFARIHLRAEMPLNHLGLVVAPHDIRDGLPPDNLMRDARGIVTWFASTPIADPLAYLTWLDRQMSEGRRLVIMGDVGFSLTSLTSIATRRQFERVTTRLGLKWRGDWISLTYASRIVEKDPTMVEFERAYPKVLPPYLRVGALGREVRSYLAVTREGQGENDDLVVTGPAGGYIALGYAAIIRDGATIVRAWYVNPFRFFREAFATDEVPKLDTTTMSGRRLYYSHIDGDAWHNVASLEIYRGRSVVAAEVVYEQIMRKYGDLPVTVAPVTGDLLESWYGGAKTAELARKIFALPNVEAGSHTHSHPFAWGFFRNPDPRRELPYLQFYPLRPGKNRAQSVWDPASVSDPPNAGKPPPYPVNGIYDRPRSYAVKPFDIGMEIEGSMRIIEQFLPPGKRVEIMQWSGDTTPWEQVFALTRKARMRNINGGDPRMDGLFDSYAWVSPLARRVGQEWQVYSSGSNENIYTDTWRRRFYGFRYLVDTLQNTETPIRVKPINVYYHFYSAEREEGLGSLRAILDHVRTQAVASVATSRFVSMVDGFLGARIVRLADQQWRIEARDGTETVRFDRASMTAVDFERSEGVVGQAHFQGSLYVALDGAVDAPVVALKPTANPESAPAAPVPYLVAGRWRVWQLQREARGWRFRAQGFGAGQFDWKVTEPGSYTITVDAGEGPRTVAATAGQDGLLSFTLPVAGESGAEIAVRREGTAE